MNKNIEKDIEFDNVIDLYKRVKPALNSKIKELRRDKIDYVKEEDIWNYLIKTKWLNAKNLVLCDVVDDILNVENSKIDRFVKDEHKAKKEELLVEDLDLI